MSKFQLILTGLCAIFIIGGVIAFASFKAKQNAEAPRLVLWGTFSESSMYSLLSDARISNKQEVNVDYVEKRADTFEKELVEALARGAGPDMVLLPHDLIIRQNDKIYTIPYESYSERIFKDSFIQGSELFLSPNGIIGLPFSVNPLVMYWNRDMFLSAGLPKPPKIWGEFFDLATKLTKRDGSGNIIQSATALGDFRNVRNAKEIFSALSLQAGDPIVVRNRDGYFESVFGMRQGTTLVPAQEALRFFTEFANPSKTSYSWNRSLPDSLTSFIGGKVAVYFGFASEIVSIREKNPNLNFDVALLPQIKDAPVPGTYGNIYALAILRNSANPAASFIAATALTSNSIISNWSRLSGLPPVRSDLLLNRPTDAYKSIFYDSALISRAWLDPYPSQSTRIFSDMVDSVTSGKLRLSDAVNEANISLSNLIPRR